MTGSTNNHTHSPATLRTLPKTSVADHHLKTSN